MSFLSYPFLWLFLPLGLILYWAVPQRARVVVLLALNLVFYCYDALWRVRLLLVLSTLITYIGACLVDKHRDTVAGKWYLALTLMANIGLMVAVKLQPLVIPYINAFTAQRGLGMPAFGRMQLPTGLSFYIFSGSSYVIDVYRQHVQCQKNFLRHAAFISFFPTITAGPILRGGVWFEQLQSQRSLSWERWKRAVMLFMWGAFLKLVIANRCAIYVDRVYAEPERYFGFYLVLAVVLYSLQIYADFAGYSMMALGVACAFGFDLPDNFRQPYLAGSIAGFWRCWHISLTSWFRDYLYIPLGGNRKGTARKYLNIMIVFIASGFWHGANVTFLLWGALHGLYQICGALTQRSRNRLYKKFAINTDVFSFRLGQRICVFVLTSLAWVLFRAQTLAQAGDILRNLLRLNNPEVLFNAGNCLTELGLGGLESTILLLSFAVLLAISLLQRAGFTLDWLQRQGALFNGIVYMALILTVLVYGIYGPEYSASAFIYAGF